MTEMSLLQRIQQSYEIREQAGLELGEAPVPIIGRIGIQHLGPRLYRVIARPPQQDQRTRSPAMPSERGLVLQIQSDTNLYCEGDARVGRVTMWKSSTLPSATNPTENYLSGARPIERGDHAMEDLAKLHTRLMSLRPRLHHILGEAGVMLPPAGLGLYERMQLSNETEHAILDRTTHFSVYTAGKWVLGAQATAQVRGDAALQYYRQPQLETDGYSSGYAEIGRESISTENPQLRVPPLGSDTLNSLSELHAELRQLYCAPAA